MLTFICHPGCTTCKKAEKWLREKGIAFEKRDIRDPNPTPEELREWHKSSGLPLRRFFNTSGQLYRQQELSARLADMSEEEQLSLLGTDGMLVRRPVLAGAERVLVGFDQKQWEALLG